MTSISSEPLDLLLNLLNRYKPHLKPYKTRINTWERILIEYNLKTGTNFKQYRTLKNKFEKIIDLYQHDKNLVECNDPKLLEILINEYNKPYRLTQRGGDEESLLHSNNNIHINGKNTSLQLESSKSSRSSTSPYITPLDTIALGMPRKDERRDSIEGNEKDDITNTNIILPPIQYPTSQRIRKVKSSSRVGSEVANMLHPNENELNKLLTHLSDKSHWLREDLSEFANNNLNNQSALITNLEQIQTDINVKFDQLQDEVTFLHREMTILRQCNEELQDTVLTQLSLLTKQMDHFKR